MERLCKVIALLLMLAPASAFGQWLVGQRLFTSGSSSPATTVEATSSGTGTTSPVSTGAWSLAYSSGDTLACHLTYASFGTNSNGLVIDATNGPWEMAYCLPYNSSNGTLECLALFPNATGSSSVPQFTVATGANVNGVAMQCAAFKGTPPSNNVLDSSIGAYKPTPYIWGVSTAGVTSANPSLASVTPSNAGEVIFAGLGQTVNGSAVTAGSGFTLLPGSNAHSGFQWSSSEYRIQTAATATTAPFTMASDTWAEDVLGICNAAAITNCTSAFTGAFNDFAGQTNGATLTAALLLNSTYGPFTSSSASWSATITGTTTFETGVTYPAPTAKFVNGHLYTGQTGIGINHLNSSNSDIAQLTVNVHPPGWLEASYDFYETGVTWGSSGNFCDSGRVATGDTETWQLYDDGTGVGKVRMESNTGLTLYANTLTLPSNTDKYHVWIEAAPAPVSYTLSAVATSSGGTAVYTTSTSTAALVVGTYLTVSGFTTTANNSVANLFQGGAADGPGYLVTAKTGTTITLANPSAVAETHAATAALDHVAYLRDTTTATDVGVVTFPVTNTFSSTGNATAAPFGGGSCGMNGNLHVSNFGINVIPVAGTHSAF